MKHLVLISICIWFFSFQAQAQFHFGARAGNNFADMSMKGLEDIHGMTKYSNKTFHIGGIIQYDISSVSDILRLESGVLLNWKGANFEYRNSNVLHEIGSNSHIFKSKNLTYLFGISCKCSFII